MPLAEAPATPSLLWRTVSACTCGVAGGLSRVFLFGASKTEVNGLDGFLDTLDQRTDVDGREKGLITVSNHVSVLDDPLIWGVLPFRYHWNPDNMRWSLGSYDICFQNKILSGFFTFGQVLPTHRSAHSQHGGLFQPTITQAIRLLSSGPFTRIPHPANTTSPSLLSPDISEPFSTGHLTYSTNSVDPFFTGHLTYSTNGVDTFPAPSAYANRKHSWVHIFPEGKVHQKEDKTMRYFKWGVARLILESEPCPDFVPMWIEGPDRIMHEAREWPRFVPRPLRNVSVTFGEKVDMDEIFGDLRARWRGLNRAEPAAHGLELSELTDAMKYGPEAVALRKECTMRVRGEILKVRRKRGLPDEDPKAGLVDTWRVEGSKGKREGKMDDGSWVKDT